MNKFKKKTRSKVIAASIAILSSAAVVSTGFAAWVITGGESQDVSGFIAADTVTDSVHNITDFAWNDEKNAQICFGAPQKETTEGNFLNYKGTIVEKLTAEATFKVANLEDGWSFSKLFKTDDLALKTTSEDKTQYFDGNLVCCLPSYVQGKANTENAGIYLETVEGTTEGTAKEKDGTFKLTVVFTWGSDTDKKNPFTYYKDMENNSSNRQLASNVITGIYNLNNVSFTMKLTTL